MISFKKEIVWWCPTLNWYASLVLLILPEISCTDSFLNILIPDTCPNENRISCISSNKVKLMLTKSNP